eukprot:jgi/Ulvmu1/2123/UM127_0008.1
MLGDCTRGPWPQAAFCAGAAHASQGLRKRLEVLQEGGELHVPDRASQRAGTCRDQQQNLADSVHPALQHGSVKKGAARLEALRVAEFSPDVLAELQRLHGEDPIASELQPTAPAPTVNEDPMHQILRHLPKGSTAGLSGWTNEHVRTVWLASNAARTQMVGVGVRGAAQSVSHAVHVAADPASVHVVIQLD